MQSDWGKFAIESENAIGAAEASKTQKLEAIDVEHEVESVDYTGSNKTVVSEARVGQAFFRKAVLSAYDYKCCITGLSIPRLLVASHIVPWHKDASNRLNPTNGLSLSMLHDKAFDIGIFTINEDMTIRVSQKLLHNSDKFYVDTLLNYHGNSISLPKKFRPHADFLDFHRKHIFEHTEILE